MKRLPFRLIAVFALTALAGAGCLPASAPPTEEPSAQATAYGSVENASLTRVATHVLPAGTHRPELLVEPDGTFLVVVVQPGPDRDDPSVQVKHVAYRYDADWNLLGTPFPVTTVTDAYGEPADHRAIIVGDEIVVVYQSNMWKEDRPTRQGNGPMETYAKNQSLLLARFTLDGELLSRVPIVANAPVGEGENFPDHAMAWCGGRLLVTTGTGNRMLTLREIRLDGTIVSAHQYPASPGQDIANEVGNSLLCGGDGTLTLVSGNGPDATDSLALTRIGSDWNTEETERLAPSGREETFPTGVLSSSGLTFVGYISREPGGAATDFAANPYAPYLKVLGAGNEILADERVGENGELHVHPTVAVKDARVYVAWSRHAETGAPQVLVTEYELSTNEK